MKRIFITETSLANTEDPSQTSDITSWYKRSASTCDEHMSPSFQNS